MALRIDLLPPNPKLQPYFPRPKIQIICTNYNLSDAELASEVAKIKAHLVQKEEAMKKSKEWLFTEFCQYLVLKEEDAKNK